MTSNLVSLWRLMSGIIFITFLVVAFLWINRHWNELRDALMPNWSVLGGVIIFCLLQLAVQVTVFLRLLGMDKKIPFRETYRAWAVANLANYLGPFQIGLAVRLAYFSRYGISFRNSSIATVRQLLASLWVGVLLCAVSLFVLVRDLRIYALCVMAFLVLVIFLRKPLVVLADRYFSTHKIFVAYIKSSMSAMTELEKFGVVSQYLVVTLSLIFMFDRFGVPADNVALIGLAASIIASSVISLLPSNVGVQEFMIGAVAHQYGATIGQAVAMSLLYRLSHPVACIVILSLTSVGRGRGE